MGVKQITTPRGSIVVQGRNGIAELKMGRNISSKNKPEI